MFDKIITVTPSPCLDISLWVDTPYCEFGAVNSEPAIVSREHIDAGGKGVNVSRVLTSLGRQNVSLSITGNKNLPTFTNILDSECVAFDCIEYNGSIRENFTITLSDGKVMKIDRKGDPITEKEITALKMNVLNNINNAQDTLVHFGGSLPVGMDKGDYISLINNIASTGAKVSIDSAILTIEDYLHIRPYMIKPNLAELSFASGREISSINDVADAIRPLKGAVTHILVSMGDEGLYYACKNDAIAIPPTVKAVSTVGAGDTTVAGFIDALASGKGIDDAVRFAAACGTASVLLEGTKAITRKMAEDMLDRIKLQEFREGMVL